MSDTPEHFSVNLKAYIAVLQRKPPETETKSWQLVKSEW